jgi:mannose-6-phosphate isomerase-like protein (cupin superfamily)
MLTYSIRHIDLSDQKFVDEFITSLKKEFFRSDIYEASNPVSIPNHYHLDHESRFILEGNATFVIDGNVFNCSPGDYIQIGPKVVHKFEYDGECPLKVMRFFSEGNEWKSYYV